MNYAMLLARGRKTGLPAPVITITQQPTNATISNTGSPPYSASLTVAATVTRGTLSYRWEALYDGVWVDVNTTFGVPETSLAYNGDTVIRSYLNYPSNTRVDTLRCVLSAPGAASVISDTATITTTVEQPPVEGWDISTAVFSQSFSVASQDNSPQGIFFKPDGLKMYAVGTGNDEVYEYNLGTAWDISTAIYVQKFRVGAQEGTPRCCFFKSDGLKMYVTGNTNDTVYEYGLSAAWDISTAIFAQQFSVAAQDTSPHCLFFRPDGFKMYIIGNGSDSAYQYDLSVAWDISTASYAQQFSVASQETAPTGIFFKPDGMKMYLVGSTGNSVLEYSLITAWDISTTSFSQSFSIALQAAFSAGLFFRPDGLKMYVVDAASDNVNEYNLSPV